MRVTQIKLDSFTAFKDLKAEFSPGINALVGANGTGKTHLMKACYAACHGARARPDIHNKSVEVFIPSGRSSDRLIQHRHDGVEASLEGHVGDWYVHVCLSQTADMQIETSRGSPAPAAISVYVPVKEMLANAPGFLSLYSEREVHFEDVFRDILLRAYLPALREPVDDAHGRMVESLENVIGGKVTVKGQEFFLSNEQGDLEFTLLAEGWRKLGLLWLLIRNGTLRDGSALFWDEPEANLNPTMFRMVIEALLELQRAGAQVFFATHDHVILKELDLQMTEEDPVAFHSLYRDEAGEIACRTTKRYLVIHPNAIDGALTGLYNRENERSFGAKSR